METSFYNHPETECFFFSAEIYSGNLCANILLLYIAQSMYTFRPIKERIIRSEHQSFRNESGTTIVW